MIEKQKIYDEITKWLQNPADLNEGMRLHTTHSKNGANKMFLATNIMRRKSLLPIYLSEIVKSLNITVSKPKETKQEEVKIDNDVVVKIKKEFPKIDFKTLPEPLKKLVFVRYDCWKRAIENHALQHTAKTDKERFDAVKATVLNMIENWQIWDEINHYYRFNRLLGKHEIFKENEFLVQIQDLEKLPPAQTTKEFMLIRRRARNNINILLRNKKRTEKQEKLLTEWIEKHNIISEKLGEPLWT